MKYILGGHWQNCPDGWESLSERQQDITKPLRWFPNSVDCLFLEHVSEHLTIIENISFFKEALRCLKAGGILRIAGPTIDKLIEFNNDALGQHYANVQLKHYYLEQDAALRELGLNGVNEEPIAFMFDSLFKGHNHRFLWTSQLLKKTLEKIGFSEVYICEPGESRFDKSNCLERTIRGVDPETVLKELLVTKYDPETMIVEAKK
jgi:SAM-dependent methyltransferase